MHIVLRDEREYETARSEIESDLDDVMGGKSRVSEFFSGKRELPNGQVTSLRELLGIPADVC